MSNETIYLPKTHARKRDGETVSTYYDIVVASLPADLQADIEERDQLIAKLVAVTDRAEAKLTKVAPRLALKQKDGTVGRILHPGDVPDISWKYGKLAMASVKPAARRATSQGGAVLL